MKQPEWFRNTSWDAAIEAAFFQKLAHAKEKSQYLRIQASTLASRHPEAALRLLDRYFETGEHFDRAQAHVDRATAYACLGRPDAAVLAYEEALAGEARDPKVQTQAWLELAFLVAKQRLSAHYARALALLETFKSRLTFPAERFRWNCALALIRSQQGDRGAARAATRDALAAAAEVHSGFRYHPSVGLVGGIDEALRKRLSELAA